MKNTLFSDQIAFIGHKFHFTPNEWVLAVSTIEKIKNEKQRFYHSFDYHIYPMIERIDASTDYNKIHFWAALFHDAIYEPINFEGNNEKDSQIYWIECAKKADIKTSTISDVSKCIIATYGHQKTGLTIVDDFLKMDLYGFTQSFDSILEDEVMVRKEYVSIDWALYKAGRIKFLNEFASSNEIIKELGVANVLKMQAQYLEFYTPKIALYPGSFKPFHAGHWDVATKAEKIFDKVIIGFATNYSKLKVEPVIPQKVKDNFQVEIIEGGLIDWINKHPYPITIIRGLRNATDLQYEQNYLEWLREVSGDKDLKFTSIFGDKSLEHISGTALRDLETVAPELYNKYIIK